jgi:hypothetical protein
VVCLWETERPIPSLAKLQHLSFGIALTRYIARPLLQVSAAEFSSRNPS